MTRFIRGYPDFRTTENKEWIVYTMPTDLVKMCTWIYGTEERNKSTKLKIPLFYKIYFAALIVHAI